MEFNKDKFVPIENIENQEIVLKIQDFNKDIIQLEKLGTHRAKFNATLKKMHDEANEQGLKFKSREQLDLEHELSVIGVQIEQLKHASHQKREALRLIPFYIAEDAGPKSEFYTDTTIPNDFKTDGRTWRLIIGNKLLNVERLKMAGAGAIVGTIPEGLVFGIPKAPKNTSYLAAFLQLLPFAIIISLLGFMEAIAIAKSMAAKTGQKLDPNQELIGQGLANIIGAFGQSYSVSGSFSRSSVNLQANAVSGVSSVVTSIVVAITLLFFTPLLYHLPQAVLASVIMMAVIGLINVNGFVHAWKAKKSDGIISVIAFACTLYFAPHLHYGIMVGVSLTFILFIYNNLRPRVALLSKAKDNTLRIAEREGLKECDHIAVVRFDGALIFTNATYLEDKVLQYIAEKPDLVHILIAAKGINDIDASGEDALGILVQSIRDSGRNISFCGMKEEVFDVLTRTHLIDKIGKEKLISKRRSRVNSYYPRNSQNHEIMWFLSIDEIC